MRTIAHVDPMRDWLALCMLAGVALTGIIVWNLWTFGTVIGGGTIGAPQASTTPTFNLSPLSTVHAIFAERAVEETKYEKGVYKFTDPSQ